MMSVLGAIDLTLIISNLNFYLRTFGQWDGKLDSGENCLLELESHTNCDLAAPSGRPTKTDSIVCSS